MKDFLKFTFASVIGVILAAVVWGVKTTAIPSRTPVSRMYSRTWLVMS